MTQRRENSAGFLWISPWILGLTAFTLLPMAMSLSYAFTDYPLLEAPIYVGWENFSRLATDPKYLHAAGRTLAYGCVVVPASTAVALVLAAMVNASPRWGRLLQAAFFLPTLVPSIAAAMIWIWLYNGKQGLINQSLSLVGMQGPNWLADASWVFPAIVLVSLWTVGHSMVVYQAAMRQVPESLYEAAALDGMGPVRRFFHVTLPMISPSILFNVVTLIIGTLQVFAIPALFSGANEGTDPQAFNFYTNELFNQAFLNGQMGYACAMAWVQLVFVLALTGLTFAASSRLVHYRGS